MNDIFFSFNLLRSGIKYNINKLIYSNIVENANETETVQSRIDYIKSMLNCKSCELWKKKIKQKNWLFDVEVSKKHERRYQRNNKTSFFFIRCDIVPLVDVLILLEFNIKICVVLVPFVSFSVHIIGAKKNEKKRWYEMQTA